MKLAVNRNKTVPALLSALSCAAIWAHLDMSSYEPLLLGAFAALYFLFSAAAVCSGRKIMLPAAVLGFVFALFTLLGNLDVLTIHKDRQTPAWLTSVLDSVGFYLPLLPFGGLLFSIGLAW